MENQEQSSIANDEFIVTNETENFRFHLDSKNDNVKIKPKAIDMEDNNDDKLDIMQDQLVNVVRFIYFFFFFSFLLLSGNPC